MVTLSAYLNDNELFNAIEAIEPFPFLVGEADNYSLIASMNYGQRKVLDVYSEKNVSEIAKYMVLMFKPKWELYLEMEELKFNLDEVKNIDETIADTEARNSSKNDTNKTASFNETELIDEGGMESISNDDVNRDKTRLLTETKISPIVKYRMLQETSKTSILERVIKDVVQELTLPIY